jgi:hypothetical protein
VSSVKYQINSNNYFPEPVDKLPILSCQSPIEGNPELRNSLRLDVNPVKGKRVTRP